MNTLKNLSIKSRKFFFFFLLLILIGVLIMWYFVFLKNQQSKVTDYIIKNEGNEQIIENKKAKFKAICPEGWQINFLPEVSREILWMHSQDIQGKTINGLNLPPLWKGCGIWFEIRYQKLSLFELQSLIKLLHTNLAEKTDEFQTILVQNRYQAIKNITKGKIYLNEKETQDYESTAVYILGENKFFTIILYYAPEEKNLCEEKFNAFLETISIK